MPRFLLIPLAFLVGLGAWVGATSLRTSGGTAPTALLPGDGALPTRDATAIRPTPPRGATQPSIQAPTELAAGWPVPAAAPRQAPAARPASVVIVIPRLGLRARVVEGGVDASGHLKVVDGRVITHFHFSASAGLPGNYVAYGHDDIWGNLFRYLGDMQSGDTVYLLQGHQRYTYRVSGSRIVAPSEVSVLAPTPAPTMTLISCTPYRVDTQRIVVRATLVAATAT